MIYRAILTLLALLFISSTAIAAEFEAEDIAIYCVLTERDCSRDIPAYSATIAAFVKAAREQNACKGLAEQRKAREIFWVCDSVKKNPKWPANKNCPKTLYCDFQLEHYVRLKKATCRLSEANLRVAYFRQLSASACEGTIDPPKLAARVIDQGHAYKFLSWASRWGLTDTVNNTAAYVQNIYNLKSDPTLIFVVGAIYLFFNTPFDASNVDFEFMKILAQYYGQCDPEPLPPAEVFCEDEANELRSSNRWTPSRPYRD